MRSDPAVSYQSNLLEVGNDDGEAVSTSSIGSESPYYSGRNAMHDNFRPSVHMIGN